MITQHGDDRTAAVAPTEGRAVAALDGNIFMSYRRDDSADVVGRILDRLNASFADREIFRDIDDIPLGVDFKRYIADAIAGAATLLVAIGPHWVARSPDGKQRLDDPNDFVRLEVKAALERDIPVIPLLVGGADMPGVADLPPTMRPLALRNGIPIRPDPDFDHDVGRLIGGLERSGSEGLLREIRELEDRSGTAEADEDWAAAEAALLRLEEPDPGRDGLAARLAAAQRRTVTVRLAAEAEHAAGEGRWVDVLSATRRLRASDPGWSDPDRLETSAEAYLALSEAQGLLADGETGAARAVVAGLLETSYALPEAIDLAAEIDAARKVRRRRRLRLSISALVVLILLSVGIRSMAGGSDSGERPPSVPTPVVEGASLSVARERIEAAGLLAVHTAEHSETVSEGRVIAQDPSAGSVIEPGSEVRLVVSRGPERDPSTSDESSSAPPQARVPAVSGKPVTQATEDIAAADLEVVIDHEHSETIVEGHVISQDPEPGRELETGSQVDLVVSLGPPPVRVPAVKEMTVEEATVKIGRAGLDADVGERRHADTVERGRVISQDPEPGSTAEAGSRVTLVESLGPAPATVPELIGMTVEEAIARLEEDRLLAALSGEDSSEAADHLVVDQDPQAGLEVEAGSEVFLVVSSCPAMVAVPSVAGRSFEEALSMLEDACLVGVGSGESFSNTIAVGHVVSHEPSGGEIEYGSEVHLVVSLGPEIWTTEPPILDRFEIEVAPLRVE